MKEDRMRFTRVRAPHDYEIGGFDFLVGNRSATCTKYCRQTDDRRSVSSSIARVDIVRPHDFPGESLRRIVHLVGRLRTAEHSERSFTGRLRCTKARNDSIEGLVPRSFNELTVLANKRRSEPCSWGEVL